jgi:hypothetical protein
MLARAKETDARIQLSCAVLWLFSRLHPVGKLMPWRLPAASFLISILQGCLWIISINAHTNECVRRMAKDALDLTSEPAYTVSVYVCPHCFISNRLTVLSAFLNRATAF